MEYHVFMNKIIPYAKRLGIDVRFENKGGKYTAKCSNGVKITGNSIAKRVEFRWGTGHTAYAYM